MKTGLEELVLLVRKQLSYLFLFNGAVMVFCLANAESIISIIYEFLLLFFIFSIRYCIVGLPLISKIAFLGSLVDDVLTVIKIEFTILSYHHQQLNYVLSYKN